MRRSILLLSALIVSWPAFAIRIDNPKIVTTLAKDQSYTTRITVSNPEDKAVSVRIYLEDFLYMEPYDGNKNFYPPYSTPFSLSNWVKYSPYELVLPPAGKEEVLLALRPGEAFDTVRCGVLFFETSLGPGVNPEGQTVEVLGRVGSLIFVNPPSAAKSVDISGVAGGGRAIHATLANTGNTFLHVSGTWYVLDEDSAVADRGPLPEAYLLPGNTTPADILLSSNLKPGSYMLVATYDLEDGDSAVREIDFTLTAGGTVDIEAVRE